MDYKKLFGRMLRKAREKRKISRLALAARLGLHWKTIHGWETGRTFVEDLSLIPALERETGIDTLAFFSKLVGRDAPKAPPPRGPEPVHFTVRADTEVAPDDWVAVPVVRLEKRSVGNAKVLPLKTVRHIVVPSAWAEGVFAKDMIAIQHNDKQMEPAVPYRAIAVVNATAREKETYHDHQLVAGFVNGRGLRVRYLQTSPGRRKEERTLVPAEGKRGFFHLRDDRDRILGKVVGVIGKV